MSNEPSDFEDPRQISEDPGPLQSVFIHLAGAEPRVFRYLPVTEASDFAKLGFTVLIPFVLALGAGSFTVYSLLEEKSLLVAIAIGALWGVLVLGMDVAMMSQLIQRVQLTGNHERSRYRSEEEVKAPRGFRLSKRWVLGCARLGIAATLGVVISHSLVSLIFHDRIEQRLESMRGGSIREIESVHQAEIERLERNLVEARIVDKKVGDPAEFLAAYESFMKLLQTSPGGAGAEAGGSQANSGMDLEFAAIDKRIQDAVGIEIELMTKVEELRREIGEMNRERTAAAEARLNERDGKAKDYTWKTRAFRDAGMPTTTSNIPSKGPRYEIIENAIRKADQIIASAQADLEVAESKARQASAEVESAKRARTSKEEELETRNRESLQAYQRERIESSNRARESLTDTIAELELELAERRAQLRKESDPFRSNSTSPASHVIALIEELGFGEGAADQDKSKVNFVRSLFLLVLACLMLLDLTPLMLKLFREVGPYEEFLAGERASASADGFVRRRSSERSRPGRGTLPPPGER